MRNSVTGDLSFQFLRLFFLKKIEKLTSKRGAEPLAPPAAALDDVVLELAAELIFFFKFKVF